MNLNLETDDEANVNCPPISHNNNNMETLLQSFQTWLTEDHAILNDPQYDILYIPSHQIFNTSIAFPKAQVLYPFAFENNFNSGGVWSMWSRTNLHVPFMCVGVYLLVVFGLQAWMSTREKFQVRTCWFYWNTMLSLFSWCGALRMVPHLVALGYHHGLPATYCGNAALTYGAAGAGGLWTGLFIFSKIPELMDTVFILLGKSKLHFLQWYHHCTVLLYTWHSYATRSGAGVWFIAMNYSVHAVMYMYFALMNVASERKEQALQLKSASAQKKALAKVQTFKNSISAFAPLVTLMQISQMFIGIAVMTFIYRDSVLFNGTEQCYVRRSSWFAGILMYSSYFILFVVFGINKYCACGGSRGGHGGALSKDKKEL